ncbi:MAG: hypothetical protein CMJ68_05190 [Planctomycetaceae bacterium]|nr:hypothetical protein [Planctomycetaceae bacterium]
MMRSWRERALTWVVRIVCGLPCLAGLVPERIEAEDSLGAPPSIPVGPETEKRFPPLQVPEGFQATLFACDPLVEYPSVISLGPRPGTLLVAHDYMTGLGVKIERRDEVRLIADSDGDGYADRSTVYAGGFNSIQGLAWHDGTVYVMHAPLLTSLRDTDGDGVAEERRDLLRGLGLEPEKNNSRLHCANGVVVGFDGWLYLSMGDNGTDVQRPEGDRLLFQEGGILRCRPDGSDLHVFAGGLRNIYDVALDDDLNVFVRDNENDGGDYMIRVYASQHGADHGYPYHYRERTDLALGPLADLGRGSSAGGVYYGESQFPSSWRGGLFFCEWGSSVVFYGRRATGAGFAPMRERLFARGAPTDPYGFKPTDVVVARDGSLLISDWCDGQRPRRGRARIYRVAVQGGRGREEQLDWPGAKTSTKSLVADLGDASRLRREAVAAAMMRRPQDERKLLARQILGQGDNDSASVRRRVHAVWLLASCGREAVSALLETAAADSSQRVRVQAVRAVADLADPVLVRDRLDAGAPGDDAVARRLAALGRPADASVHREVIVALGRLQWPGLPDWLKKRSAMAFDAARLHAGQQALRRVGRWNATLALLDLPSGHPARMMALRAVADQFENDVVEGLIDRLREDGREDRRRDYAEWLTRIWKKPAPWKYWGYRPPPRPAHTVSWDQTEAIETALGGALGDTSRIVRVGALLAMRNRAVPVDLDLLATWLRTERDAKAVAALVQVLATETTRVSTAALEDVVTSRQHKVENRLAALEALNRRWKGTEGARLVVIGGRLGPGPVLSQVVRHVGQRNGLDDKGLLLRSLESKSGSVRAAAVAALVDRKHADVPLRVAGWLADSEGTVRIEAARAVGQLGTKVPAEGLTAPLVSMASDRDPAVRSAGLAALARRELSGGLDAARKGLDDQATLGPALDYLARFGEVSDLGRLQSLARIYRSASAQARVLSVLDAWQARRVANEELRDQARSRLQGDGGQLLRWRVSDVMSPPEADSVWASAREKTPAEAGLRTRVEIGEGGGIRLPRAKDLGARTVRIAWTDCWSESTRQVEFLAAAGGRVRFLVNGHDVYRRDGIAGFRPDSDRFEAKLRAGNNRVVAWVEWNRPSRLQLRFRDRTLPGVLETYAQRALREKGDTVRGERVFRDLKRRGLCARCHRIGVEGGRIGPDLTGIGRRFSRIHLIESVLEPSRAMAPSYQTRVVVLESGRVLTGVKVAETPTELTLGDKEGQLHKVAKSDIEEESVQRISTMPDGIDKRLTQQDFIDLIEFLVSQQQSR